MLLSKLMKKKLRKKEDETIPLEDKKLEHFKILLKEKNNIEISKFIENNLETIINGMNIVHLVLTHCYDNETLKFSVKELIKYKDKIDWYFLDSDSKYTPIQALVIRNHKFYENNLVLSFEILFEIYKRKDLERIYDIELMSDFYFYKNFCNFSLEEKTNNLNEDISLTNFLLKKIKEDKEFTYPKYLNEIFNGEELIKFLPKEPFFNYKEITNFDQLSLYISNRNTKSFKKMILREIVSKNYIHLEPIQSLCKAIRNDDICLIVIDRYIKTFQNIDFSKVSEPLIREENSEQIKLFLTKFSYHQFIKYFIEDEKRFTFFHDTLRLFSNLLEKDETLVPNIKDFKNLKEFHDALSRELLKIKNKPFALNQNEISVIDKKEVKGLDLFVNIPKNNLDLIYTGSDLKLCIGSLNYAEKINSKQCYMIFLVDSENKVKMVIHFSLNFKIIEAKKNNNEFLTMTELKIVQDFLFNNLR